MGSPREVAEGIRRRRRQVIESIAAGTTPLASVDADAAQVKVVNLVEAVPGIGKVRGRRILDELGVPHAARWGELPASVVDRVLAALERAVHDQQAGREA